MVRLFGSWMLVSLVACRPTADTTAPEREPTPTAAPTPPSEPTPATAATPPAEPTPPSADTTSGLPQAEVKGSLDKDIIRRVVRANIADVRGCYNEGLARDATLKGRVMIQFVIAPKGESMSVSHSRQRNRELR